jgi:hypothetical protein
MAGGGPIDMSVKTTEPDQRVNSTSDLAKLRRATKPGGEIFDRWQDLKKSQAPLRAQIEGLVKETLNETHPLR